VVAVEAAVHECCKCPTDNRADPQRLRQQRGCCERERHTKNRQHNTRKHILEVSAQDHVLAHVEAQLPWSLIAGWDPNWTVTPFDWQAAFRSSKSMCAASTYTLIHNVRSTRRGSRVGGINGDWNLSRGRSACAAHRAGTVASRSGAAVDTCRRGQWCRLSIQGSAAPVGAGLL
jgi:hypothetical protein